MKELMLGNTKIIFEFSKEPEQKIKNNLKRLYDVCNEIFKDKPECFYTHEEVEKLKQDPNNIFI